MLSKSALISYLSLNFLLNVNIFVCTFLFTAPHATTKTGMPGRIMLVINKYF